MSGRSCTKLYKPCKASAPALTPQAVQIPLSRNTDAVHPPRPPAAHHVIDSGPLRVSQQGDESRQQLGDIVPLVGGRGVEGEGGG